MDEEIGFDSEEDFLDDELEDLETEDNDLNIIKTFWDSDDKIVYILLEEGSYKKIRCSGINEAKNLHLAILNR